MYDVCIVGAGTMGSSTAYHLSRYAGIKTCLVGPLEPKHKTSDCDVFGCHYDEGRITRIISPIESEQILAYRSMLGYERLEIESGLKIFTEVGFAALGETGDNYIKDFSNMTDKFCKQNDLSYEEMTLSFVKENWDHLNVPSTCSGCYSKKYNGYISVRNLVKACQLVFTKNGGERINFFVKEIREVKTGFDIELSNGNIISAAKVVVTCGSFSNFFNLLPSGLTIDYQLIGHTVMRFELGHLDFIKLQEIPSMIFKPSKDVSDYVYILPPIKYPNGKIYIKFGHTVHPENDHQKIGKHLESLQDVKNWYCQSDYPKAHKYFTSNFAKIFPDISPISEELDFCVMAITPSGKQYIDFIKDGLLLGTGGNGKSAKFGLEIGNICAKNILSGQWDYDLDKNQFAVQYKLY